MLNNLFKGKQKAWAGAASAFVLAFGTALSQGMGWEQALTVALVAAFSGGPVYQVANK